MLLIIDNYDSFTYNLYHYFGELGYAADVYRNDEIAVDRIIKLNPKGIVISPGPCGPEKAGISVDLVKAVARDQKIPLLGVCLGHQAIAAAFGGCNVVVPDDSTNRSSKNRRYWYHDSTNRSLTNRCESPSPPNLENPRLWT